MQELIRTPFAWLLGFLYDFTANYGLALILFSLVVKMLMLPFSAKSKKSTMKMSRLQPQLKQLELACGDDKQKYQQETMKLYKEEGVSMFGGCLWSFLPLLFLIPLYAVIREPLHYLMGLSDEQVEAVKAAVAAAQNVEASSLNYYWQYTAAQNIELYGKGIVEGIKSLNFTFLGIDLGQTPNWKIWQAKSWNEIGGFLIPVVSGALNLLSMLVSQKMNNTVISNEDGQRDKAAAKTAQSGQTMMYLMPLISVVFGFMWPLGLSIYWIAQSAFGIVQDYFLTKHYRKVYDAEDEIKRQKAAVRAAEEAERERIRAAKRAANPDGITENTSKKKQQLRERQERENAAREYEARKLSEQEAAPQEDVPSGDAARPYSRGRAYSPEHYSNHEEE